MREFLWTTYGDHLRQTRANGGVVLDVAGGKGDLSWLLCNVDRMNSVVVDPRDAVDCHIVKSVRYLQSHPMEAQERAIPNRPTHQPLAALIPRLQEHQQDFEKPRHLRILVNQRLVDAVRDVRRTKDLEVWRSFWDIALREGREVQPHLGTRQQDSMSSLSADNEPNPYQVHDARDALDLLLKTRLVVGFHPDQATDACIDLAMELGVPFCVVPCCVFPKEFPHRRRDGKPVKKYEHLIPYLRAKVSCRTAELDFFETKSARNIVLYTLPGDIT